MSTTSISMTDPFESPYAGSLRALDKGALRRLQAVLQDDAADQRDRIMHDLMRVPPSMGAQLLGQLLAICDTDRIARLEVLRGIRDALGTNFDRRAVGYLLAGHRRS